MNNTNIAEHRTLNTIDRSGHTQKWWLKLLVDWQASDYDYYDFPAFAKSHGFEKHNNILVFEYEAALTLFLLKFS